jgi:hypothetical protein
MIKIEKVETFGWEAAIRGMRNPKNSWDRSDSHWCRMNMKVCPDCKNRNKSITCIGQNDFDLMMRLRNAGTDHRKFIRMLTVYLDITAPLYWWKEYDTYKVGTVANSCSTMHKIAAKEFELSDFSIEHVVCVSDFKYIVDILNCWRSRYIQCDDDPAMLERLDMTKKEIWWQMIQFLPSSYNQKRTVMLNYEVLANIYKSRKDHKLDEWREFCHWIESLPYSELIVGNADGEKQNDCT